MKWLYKLERKFGHVYIHNLMLILVAGQAMVYLLDLLAPSVSLSYHLALYWPLVLRGQVWRLLTFVFVPLQGGILALALTLYLTYIIGHTLEMNWGEFQFNVYYLLGVVGAIIAAAISGAATTEYINLSLFLAFAMLYPDFQLLLFFIFPVKVKYLAWLAAALYLVNFLFGTWSARFSILFSLLNFILFFGGDFWRKAKQEIYYYKNRRAWHKNNRNNWR
jgi:hypothetical protein